MRYFEEFYGGHSPPEKFLERMDYMWFYRDGLLKRETERATERATERKELSNNAYGHMKDVAKNFIRRIKKCFSRDIAAAIDRKTPLQDAEALLAHSSKLTYRWAAGIIASNHIATILIKLSKFRSGEKYKDDIITLKDNLNNRTANRKLRIFLIRSHRRFEDADKVRNRCAHVIEGDPTKQEIEQSIALARLLQKYLARR